MQQRWAIGLLVAILAVGMATAPATGAPSLGSDPQQVGGLDSDLVVIGATISESGTATFEIQYAIRLEDANDTKAFEDLAADIEQNESAYLGRFADRMNATVDAAESATGRSMTIGEFEVRTNTTGIGKEYGLVTYSATWTNFAVASEDRIVAGDAVAGLFLDEETRFRMTWPEGYVIDTVSPDPTDRTTTQVAWAGPRTFDADQPSVTLVPGTAGGGTTAAPSTTDAGPAGQGPPWFVLGAVLLLALVGLVWYQRREDDSSAAVTGATTEEPTTTEASESTEDSPPPELLSNEERVEQYLESEGGRAKQQELVDALDWTEAKTSQVLSEMADSGAIEKFRIGRENVVKLPDSGDEGL